MQKDKQPERGGGVKLATRFVKIKEVLNKNGEVIKTTIEKPGDKKEVRPMERIRDRLR